MYLISPEVLILCARALLIFSEFSLAMNASLALCIAFKLLQMILLEGVAVSAGALLLIIDGRLGFVLMAIWSGEKLWLLEREFLALTHQATASSKSHWVSSKTLSRMSASIRLCLSTK